MASWNNALPTVRRRVVRLARQHGIDVEGDGIGEGDRHDELVHESPLLAGLAAASVAGRAAIGAEVGDRAVRLGRATEVAPDESARVPCHARIAGFDLHAGVAVPAGDRARLEHLCRYVLRPPIAQGSLAIASDGCVRLELRRPWRDGTRALLAGPLDFLGRLTALTPKPASSRRSTIRTSCGGFSGISGSRRPSRHRCPRDRRLGLHRVPSTGREASA